MLQEQIVILIMQKDQDEQTMSQVDGMIKLIDREPSQATGQKVAKQAAARAQVSSAQG